MAEGVNQYKDLTLIFENTVAFPFKIYTDMPGRDVALRRTIIIPVTVTREEITFPFDGVAASLVDGKLIKYRAEPTGVFKLYAGFVRFRRIGEYIDGTMGEIWETQEITLSP